MRPNRIPNICTLLLMMCSSGFSAASSLPPYDIDEARAKAQADSLFVSCSPDKPVVSQDELVQLKAYATTLEGKPFGEKLTYSWSVSLGRITDKTAEVQWVLKDAKPGNYVATVQVIAETIRKAAECSLEIVIQSSEQSKGLGPDNDIRATRETGRSFLLSNQHGHKGYGLHSYLILGGPPSDNSRQRYLKTIEAYLSLLPDIARLEKYFPPSELNITYLPVNTELPNITDIKLLAEWVLKHYDYPHARFLIRRLSGDNREGPYIVSVSLPLSAQTAPSYYLWQDLSVVPEQLAGSWIKEFMNQAAQERFWETRNFPVLRLRLRSAIAVLAIALPDIQHSLDSYIRIGQSVSP